MEQDRTVLPFQALTLRERVIAELSFPLLDKGTDAVTIGDVRQIADRIVALIAEQSDGAIIPDEYGVQLDDKAVIRELRNAVGGVQMEAKREDFTRLAIAAERAIGRIQQAL